MIHQDITKMTPEQISQIEAARISKEMAQLKMRNVMRPLLDFIEKDGRIINLKDRWLDEREYEDFAEYKAMMEKILTEAGYKVKKITKSFTITLQHGEVEVELKIGASKISCSARILKA